MSLIDFFCNKSGKQDKSKSIWMWVNGLGVGFLKNWPNHQNLTKSNVYIICSVFYNLYSVVRTPEIPEAIFPSLKQGVIMGKEQVGNF